MYSDKWGNRDLIPLDEYTRGGSYDLQGAYDPTGHPVYGLNNDKIGTVKSAMVEPQTGRIRYLLVNTGGFFNNKQVMVPVGMARIEDDGVYFDNLTKDQLRDMSEYREGSDWSTDYRARDERVLTGRDYDGTKDRWDYRDHQNYRSPQRLQLLEERLNIDKRREKVGEVEVGKRVETHRESADVELKHDEVVISRHPVNEQRPTGAANFGADRENIRMDLEAERADVDKQTFVREEVEVSKRDVAQRETVSAELRSEDVDVRRTGDVNLVQDGAHVDRGSDTERRNRTDRDKD